MKALIQFLLSSLAIFVTAYLLEDFGIRIQDFGTAIIVALVLALLNFFVKPVITILTLPVTVLTLGIFLLFINAFIIYLAGYFVSGFSVNNIWVALLFGFIYSLVMSFLNFITGAERK